MVLTTLIAKFFSFLVLLSYSPSPELSSIHIEGTSTLHDWVIQVEDIRANGSLNSNEGVFEANDLSFTFPVKGLESGKSAMNTNTCNALNEEKYPNITLKDIKVSLSPGKSYLASGLLTISGTSKAIKFPLSISNIENKRVLATGNCAMKMTDFNVEPPEVMWGTISTGNDIVIKFNIIFSNQ